MGLLGGDGRLGYGSLGLRSPGCRRLYGYLRVGRRLSLYGGYHFRKRQVNIMPDWDWETDTWICPDETCAYKRNHALANFCAMCGEPVEKKSTDAVASIFLGKSVHESSLNVPMNRVDRLFNIYGRPLLVDMSQGAMKMYPAPMSNIQNFNLPDIPRTDVTEQSVASHSAPRRRKGESLDQFLRQVAFDRWWIYALRRDGCLYLFPVSALASENMAVSTLWRPGPSNIQAFVCVGDHLFLLDQERRTIHVYKVDEEGYRNQWEKGRGVLLAPIRESFEVPFLVEEMVAIHGSRQMVGLIGKMDMALLSGEGMEHRDQSFRKESLGQWVGTLRGGSPRIAAVTVDLKLQIRVCYPDREELLVDPVETGIYAVRPLQIESEYWFAAISSSRIQLFDPLDRQMKCDWSCPDGVSLEHMEWISGFGDVLAGFQRPTDRTKPLQFCLIRLNEGEGFSVRSFNLHDREIPIVPPAGFGRYVYLVTRSRKPKNPRLVCYDLQKT